MDLRKYIQSGILENYVLGLISEMETKEVERNLNQYPQLKKELNQIENTLAFFAKSKAMPMPADLPKKIMQSIDDLSNNSSPHSKS